MAEAISEQRDLPAKALLGLVRQTLQSHAAANPWQLGAMVVVKRR